MSLKAFLDERANSDAVASYYKDVFEAMMEGAAICIDLIGPIETTYTTKSGNKVRIRLDSP